MVAARVCLVEKMGSVRGQVNGCSDMPAGKYATNSSSGYLSVRHLTPAKRKHEQKQF